MTNDIADNVLKNWKAGIKQNMSEMLEEFVDEYADEMWEMTQEIIKLRAENFELKARLENAVELKAKVGDVIYMPWKYDGTFDIARLLITGIYFKKNEFHYITDLESDSAIYLAKYQYGIFQNKDFNSIVFTDRAAAEARLAELKGEKE